MKKRWFAGMLTFLILCMLSVTAFAHPHESAEGADAALYTEKEVPVFREGKEDGTLPLRFYEETPNVPYMGIAEYSQYIKEQQLTLKDNGDGTFALVNPIGEELLCDPQAGVIMISDWNRFFDLPLPLEDVALGWKDTSTHFARMTDIEYEGEPETVILDFDEYGMKIYADQEDIYLPLATLVNIMTDIATNHILYNGENLYAMRASLDGTMPEGYYESEMYQKQLQGEPRPDDVVNQCYADLCFNFDHFFGHPGKAKLDEAIAEKGLDQALTDQGKKGQKLKEKLLSPDLYTYLNAMNELFLEYLSDGHTLFMSNAALMGAKDESSSSLLGGLGDMVGAVADLIKSPVTMKQLAHETIPPQRLAAWGNRDYIESGNTAIIRLDGFMPDEDAWHRYYDGEGDFPQDCVGTVITGLRKASENPEIKNVIIDLSCNSGGSPDAMMAILAVTTGQDQLYGLQKITGQPITFTFEIDSNFDGVYDEKDKDVKYDFNYGALVTRHAFSCGNLFPIIAQEGGFVLLGEPSSGGSCCVQIGTDTSGLCYMMSSAQWQLLDSEGNSVEGGCSIDLPIETTSNKVLDKFAGIINIDEGIPGFGNYFDAERLDAMMNEYFAAESETELDFGAETELANAA